MRRYVQGDDPWARLRAYAPEGELDECWLWTGALVKGYGVVTVATGKSRQAHVLTWELTHGQSLPEGRVTRHTCDTPACVNPRHIILGTHADNMADKADRGRWAPRTEAFRHRTAEEVEDIHRLATEGVNKAEIARRMGCSRATVIRILSGRSLAGGHRRSSVAKLAAADIAEVRRLREAGWSQQRIAQRFDVAQTTIGRLLRGDTYGR